MSEMKVKVLDDTLESKSVQEVEQDLLKKHEQEQQEEAVNENETVQEKETTTETAENQTVEQSEQESIAQEFTEKDVLSCTLRKLTHPQEAPLLQPLLQTSLLQN